MSCIFLPVVKCLQATEISQACNMLQAFWLFFLLDLIPHLWAASSKFLQEPLCVEPICVPCKEKAGGYVNYFTWEKSALYLSVSEGWSFFSSDKYTGSFWLQESCKHCSKPQAQHRGWVTRACRWCLLYPGLYIYHADLLWCSHLVSFCKWCCLGWKISVAFHHHLQTLLQVGQSGAALAVLADSACR